MNTPVQVLATVALLFSQSIYKFFSVKILIVSSCTSRESVYTRSKQRDAHAHVLGFGTAIKLSWRPRASSIAFQDAIPRAVLRLVSDQSRNPGFGKDGKLHKVPACRFNGLLYHDRGMRNPLPPKQY